MSERVPVDTGVWHHLAFTNDAGGNQSIYLDGEILPLFPAHQSGPRLNPNLDLTLGGVMGFTSLKGAIDDARVYGQLLDDFQIAALAVPVPEPSSFLLVAISTGLVLRRLRTSARTL